MQKKKNIKFIINLSTVSIYGISNKGIVKETDISKDQDLLGFSKEAAEKILQQQKINHVSLRLPGVLCSKMNKKNPLWIQKTILKIKKNIPLKIYDIDNKFNNVVDVNEIFNLIVLIVKFKKKINSVFNFSATSPIKLAKVIYLIKKKFNSKSKILNQNRKKKSFVIFTKKN